MRIMQERQEVITKDDPRLEYIGEDDKGIHYWLRGTERYFTKDSNSLQEDSRIPINHATEFSEYLLGRYNQLGA